MLVLQRKPGEAIVTDGPCKIVLIAMHRDKVDIGIEAAPHVTVHREEIWQRIMRERRDGAGGR